MLSCSTASSLDRATSPSLGRAHGETLRLLGYLKSVPPHLCLGNRTYFLSPWKKGVLTK